MKLYVNIHKLLQQLSRSTVDTMILYREFTMTLTSLTSMLTYNNCLSPERL